MLTITRWAGKHHLFVRLVLLPILFYLQGRLAFTAGAELFFKGVSLPFYWVWIMVSIIWLATLVYPANARKLLSTAYLRIKGMEFIACTAAFGLWLYAGNMIARQAEQAPLETHQQSAVRMVAASVMVSEEAPAVTRERSSDNKLKKAYRRYFRNAVLKTKHNQATGSSIPTGVAIALGVIGIGLGIIVLVCGIGCGTTGGGVALAVVGGAALVGLGVWALIAGFRKTGKVN